MYMYIYIYMYNHVYMYVFYNIWSCLKMGYTHQMAFFYGTHAGNPLELIELGFPSIFCWLNQHKNSALFPQKDADCAFSMFNLILHDDLE